jgi:tetratricopeptide (TPR) repeat protein
VAPALVVTLLLGTNDFGQLSDHALGHMLLGFVEIFTKRAAEGIDECEHALALDRNLVHAHSYIGLGKILTGRAEETEAHVGEALRLSPRDTMAYVWMSIAGIAKSNPGGYEQAVAWSRRAIEANRNYHQSYFWLAAALAHLGRLDEARAAVMSGLALNPAFTTLRAGAAWTAMSDNHVYLASIEPTLEGMRRAGVPEQ